MDLKTSFFLNIRLFGNNSRVEGGWYSFSKIVDSDYTNFKDFVDDILHSHSSGYNDVVKLFYLSDEGSDEIREVIRRGGSGYRYAINLKCPLLLI